MPDISGRVQKVVLAQDQAEATLQPLSGTPAVVTVTFLVPGTVAAQDGAAGLAMADALSRAAVMGQSVTVSVNASNQVQSVAIVRV